MTKPLKTAFTSADRDSLIAGVKEAVALNDTAPVPRLMRALADRFANDASVVKFIDKSLGGLMTVMNKTELVDIMEDMRARAPGSKLAYGLEKAIPVIAAAADEEMHECENLNGSIRSEFEKNFQDVAARFMKGNLPDEDQEGMMIEVMKINWHAAQIFGFNACLNSRPGEPLHEYGIDILRGYCHWLGQQGKDDLESFIYVASMTMKNDPDLVHALRQEMLYVRWGADYVQDQINQAHNIRSSPAP